MAEHPFGHEPSAIRTKRVLAPLGILAIFVLLAVATLHFVKRGLLPQHARVVEAQGKIPPPPRLQPDPQVDIDAERSQKRHLLSSYAWLDGSHHYARIPIQRAMQLYVRQQHAEVRGAGPADASRSAR